MSEFDGLRAEIDRDERNARGALDDRGAQGNGVRMINGELAIKPSAMSDALTSHFVRHPPARAERDAQAKRAILDEYERDPQADDQYRAGLAFALERLADAYRA